MDYFDIFILGFILSFIGSIPPGTLNISVFQLSLANRINTSLRFAIAVVIVEYPYSWLGVNFQNEFLSNHLETQTLKLISAVMMILIGLNGFRSKTPSSGIIKRISESGFRKGLAMSFLNPIAIIYWATITAYFKMQGWLQLSTQLDINIFVMGACLGTLVFLFKLIFLAKWLSFRIQNGFAISIIPKLILIAFGCYMLFDIVLL